jgi:hypothetical protein
MSKVIAEAMKKNMELRNRLSSPGIMNKNRTLSKFVSIPEYPFPSIMAPMYLPGRKPPKPNTVA